MKMITLQISGGIEIIMLADHAANYSKAQNFAWCLTGPAPFFFSKAWDFMLLLFFQAVLSSPRNTHSPFKT